MNVSEDNQIIKIDEQKILIGTNIFEESNDELVSKIKKLPTCMSVHDVSDFLGIGLTSAYKLVKSSDFPRKELTGINRVIIPKVKFVEWYLS